MFRVYLSSTIYYTGMISFVSFHLASSFQCKACTIFNEIGISLHIECCCVFAGWSYVPVVRARWISGLLLALMASPLLKGMGATSPLLSWLPVVVAAYCCYGVCLSFKRHKVHKTSLIIYRNVIQFKEMEIVRLKCLFIRY